MAATGQIGFWTVVLLCGQVLPLLLLLISFWLGSEAWVIFGATFLLSYATRSRLAMRFDQSAQGGLLHPLAILLLLTVQWYAIGRAICGKPIGWKGREKPIVSEAKRESQRAESYTTSSTSVGNNSA
jgi:hypothetical protein